MANPILANPFLANPFFCVVVVGFRVGYCSVLFVFACLLCVRCCVWAGRARTRQPENSKRAHLRAPALQTPPKFHERTPSERKKKENCGGRREKKARNFGPPTLLGPTFSGSHPSGPHNFGPSLWALGGAYTFRAPPFGPHHDTNNIGQKIGLDWTKKDWRERERDRP